MSVQARFVTPGFLRPRRRSLRRSVAGVLLGAAVVLSAGVAAAAAQDAAAPAETPTAPPAIPRKFRRLVCLVSLMASSPVYLLAMTAISIRLPAGSVSTPTTARAGVARGK